MPYRASPSRSDRVKAIGGVATVYVVMLGALLLVRTDAVRRSESQPTVLIDVRELPRHEPPPQEEPGRAEDEEGAAGKKAEPTPVDAPRPAVVEMPS